MCSTFHSAKGGQTVQRRVKTGDGQWTTMTVPIPTVLSNYNKWVNFFFSGSSQKNCAVVIIFYILTVFFLENSMGGVDTSDALIGLYSVVKKIRKWYRTIFFHFVDIAVVNTYIIHQQLAAMQNKRAKTQSEFWEALVQELVDWVPPHAAPASHLSAGHTPKHITPSSKCKQRCRMCHQKTPVICCRCDVPLCFLPKRECFSRCH